MKGRTDCDFSFSGLKNAFRLAVERSLNDLNLLSVELTPADEEVYNKEDILHTILKFEQEEAEMNDVSTDSRQQDTIPDDGLNMKDIDVSGGGVGDGAHSVEERRRETEMMSIAERRREGIKRSDLKKKQQQARNLQVDKMKKAIARAVNVEEAGAKLPHQRKADLAASFQVRLRHGERRSSIFDSVWALKTQCYVLNYTLYFLSL